MAEAAFRDEQVLISAEELSVDPMAYTILHATVSFPKPRFDGDYRPESGYATWCDARIPGSLHADLLDGFSARDTRLHFSRPAPDDLASALAELGVAPDADLVIYDDGSMTWASRLWWMLRNVGIPARVLDGGLARWTALRLPVDSGDIAGFRAATPRTGLTDRGLWRDREDVLAVVSGDAPGTLVCALDAEQFAGTATTRYARRGHISGSRNLPAKSVLADGVLHSTDRVDELAEAALAGSGRPLILYCGGGVSACLLALALVRAGHTDLAVYDGSLEEWTADPALPMRTLEERSGGA
ncbi:rhodanese-like domain-containing protein [Rhodococcus sp. NPDC047139]|uniref:sulfurtransferase n=1 Tax=Rhodococcus sp. NPDC047139 TaxID=3155141 RepID=UPI0033C2821B